MGIDEDIEGFLKQCSDASTPEDPDFPYITLTYAQSLDARIAGKGGKQLRLSGKESMRLTHHLRARHDSILVGIGTMFSDNPQLNARELPEAVPVERQPRPIVIDTFLRTPPTCKLLNNLSNGVGRQPMIVCSGSAPLEARTSLEEAGAEVVSSTSAPDSGRLDLQAIFKNLKSRGYKRLMIEGGSSIITSCLEAVREDGSPLVDSLLVTVAPTVVGDAGVPVTEAGRFANGLPRLVPVITTHFGHDAVFFATLR